MSTTTQVPPVMQCWDTNNEVQAQAVASRWGTATLRQLIKTCLVRAEKSRMTKDEFLKYVGDFYYKDADDKKATLTAIEEADRKQELKSWVSMTEDQLIAVAEKDFLQFKVQPGSTSSAFVASRVGEEYFYSLPRLAVHLLTAANILIPIGSPAVGYGLRFEKDMGKLTVIMKEMIANSTEASLVPLIEWFDVEGYFYSQLLAEYDTAKKVKDDLAAQVKELEATIVSMKQHMSSNGNYGWEV